MPPSVQVVVMGGLGNQMFQVATGYAHAMTQGVPFYIQKNKNSDDGRAVYWDSVLARFKWLLVDTLPAGATRWNEPGDATQYYPIPSVPENGLRIHGYFQSPKYFGDHANLVRALMKAPESLQVAVQNKWPQLFDREKEVVVVHARRTDYCKNSQMVAIHGPLSVRYYQNAVQEMCKKVKSPHFLLVSDDNSFWPAVLSMCPEISKAGYSILDSDSDVETLTLLQQFRHFIIANSTFSWWAAWLSESKNVYAPDTWFGPAGPKHYEDIYEKGWTRIAC